MTFDPSKFEELQRKRATERRLLTFDNKYYGSCLSCHFWLAGTEECSKVQPPQRPPATVIVNSCQAWYNEDIPF